MRFSANLGFLFRDRPLIDAVAASARAGFGAVEFHRPFETTSVFLLRDVLNRAGLPVITMNTSLGDRQAGERGLCALPGREADARADIDRAIAYAAAIGAHAVNVLAGIGGEANTYMANLAHAAAAAHRHGMKILIEPQNTRDHPDYFLNSVPQAAALLNRFGAENVGILFDCYHVAVGGGDPLTLARAHIDLIGHVQIAGTPDRGRPDTGDTDYTRLLPELRAAGYAGYFGAEYRPGTNGTEAGLGWLKMLAAQDCLSMSSSKPNGGRNGQDDDRA